MALFGAVCTLFAVFLNGEFFGKLLQKLLFRKTVQVLDNAVVVHDCKLVFRKGHGKEKVELLAAVKVRKLLAPFESHLDRGRAAVVSVGNVKRVNF